MTYDYRKNVQFAGNRLDAIKRLEREIKKTCEFVEKSIESGVETEVVVLIGKLVELKEQRKKLLDLQKKQKHEDIVVEVFGDFEIRLLTNTKRGNDSY